MAISFHRLEIHATHTCNFNCESCSHFSGTHHKLWLLTPKILEDWILPWKDRIIPRVVGVLGGEPTINSYLIDLIKVIRSLWKDTLIVVVTNGTYLQKFPELGKILSKHGKLHLTLHYKNIFPNKDLINFWKNKYELNVKIEKAWYRWSRRYIGMGELIKPFKSDPLLSWNNCAPKGCRQLFDGNLWKCSTIAYLQVQKKTFPNISAEWDQYLSYQPIKPNCNEAQLKKFFNEKSIPICSMCPEYPEKFETER